MTMFLSKKNYLSKGCGARKLLNKFPDKSWKLGLGSIDYLLSPEGNLHARRVALTDSEAVADRVRNTACTN